MHVCTSTDGHFSTAHLLYAPFRTSAAAHGLVLSLLCPPAPGSPPGCPPAWPQPGPGPAVRPAGFRLGQQGVLQRRRQHSGGWRHGTFSLVPLLRLQAAASRVANTAQRWLSGYSAFLGCCVDLHSLIHAHCAMIGKDLPCVEQVPCQGAIRGEVRADVLLTTDCVSCRGCSTAVHMSALPLSSPPPSASLAG